jgi:hypothetical protein
MKTKIAPASGLILIAILGVLGAMVALGMFQTKSVLADHTDGTTHVITESSVTATADPNDPGAVAKWTVTFDNPTTVPGNTGELIIEFEDDVKVPSVISPADVTITAERFSNLQGTAPATGTVVANPLGVNVRFVAKYSGTSEGAGAKDEPEVTLTVGDMEPSTSTPGVQGILGDILELGGTTRLENKVTVAFRQTAGIVNPSEAKGGFKADGTAAAYKVQVATNVNATTLTRKISADLVGAERSAKIVRKILLSDADAARGKTITVIGKGFKNGTTATVWQDDDGDGTRDSGEIDLGSAIVGGDDTFSASVTVTVPPFVAGNGSGTDINYINAVDGRNNTLNSAGDFTIPKFKVEGSVAVTPGNAGVGDTVQIDLKDFDATGTTAFTATSSTGLLDGVPLIKLGGKVVDTPTGAINASGEATFNVAIPNGVSSGTQALEITGDGASFAGSTRRANIVISSAILTLTPEAALVPNQTVTVIGRGYTTGGNATINTNADASSLTISGSSAHLKTNAGNDTKKKLNEGNSISVDNGGNWSASLVIPITTVSTTAGTKELKITDSSGREGVVAMNLAPRTLVMTPSESRVGTTVNISGTGYPADNTKTGSDSTPSVTIEYTVSGTARSVATLTPDSSGNITGSFVVPLDAGIPSTNAVRAKYTIPKNDADTATGGEVTTAVTHEVPRAILSIDPVDGPVGTLTTITGEGFKTFSTVKTLQVGDIDVRPAPVPATDEMGGFSTTVVIPQLNTGTHSVKGEVSTTTASGTFTVLAAIATATPAPVVASEAPADALAALISNSDNLQRVWHFDPSAQSEAPDFGWYLYDPRPVFAAANSVDEMAGGKFYWINVREAQTAILGGASRSLFAGWNPVTW